MRKYTRGIVAIVAIPTIIACVLLAGTILGFIFIGLLEKCDSCILGAIR